MIRASLLSITILLIVFLEVVQSNDIALIGFGAQRLKRATSKVFSSRQNQKNELSSQENLSITCDNVKQFWFKNAVVDNFAPIHEQVFWAEPGQRYWINEEFWGGKGSPIFVFIGGEGAESCTRLTSRMYLYSLAQEHNAMLVDIEHRFYGESYPTSDLSLDSLKHLSADQALADLARVIGHIKTSYGSDDSKVITVGGSYPGNLAAWFRLKYPSVTHGSIASSAPVTAKLDFYEYMEVVGNSIQYYSGQPCYDAFERAANTVAAMAAEGVGSVPMLQLQKDFSTCADISSSLDLAVLYSDLMGNVQGTVQYNREGGSMNVTDVCAVMTDSDDSYAQFVQLSSLYRSVNGASCEDASFRDMTTYLSNVAKDPSNSARPWTYQTCNEFGYYQTTNSRQQPFHAWGELNLNFSRAICAAAFDGWTEDPQVSWINQEYGAVNIEGTNIVFPSGTIDPWHVLGVTNSSALAQATEEPVYILGTAHCNDLYAPASSDPQSLTDARVIIAQHLSAWLL